MPLTQNRWYRRLGFGAIAAVSLGAAAMMTSPAQAQDYGYRPPVVAMHYPYYAPRIFFGFGGGYHQDRWDHGNRWDHHWR
ncbi:MAG TPA: hypothetical protein VN808_08005 [Stellaceae bacterium]|nr:hypothetical protein [Stellaceae bacterium]